ncbi:hypothetical protein AKO1_009229 [Acrasis kona]|uniref:Transcription factor SPT20 homolog n=1 Tax=Acrasis kona TaxID=1008807 RepID=A0AAW2ZKM8_9EUKA
MGFNPYLQVKVKNTKPISYVVKHLEKKWRTVLDKVNETRPPSHCYQFRIYPRQTDFSMVSQNGWGRDDEGPLQKIHADLFSPNVLQLDYDVKEVDVSHIFNLNVPQQPHVVQLPQQTQLPVNNEISTQSNFYNQQQLQLQKQLQQQLRQQMIQQQQQQQQLLLQQQQIQQFQQQIQMSNSGLDDTLLMQQLQLLHAKQAQQKQQFDQCQQIMIQEQNRLQQLQKLASSVNVYPNSSNNVAGNREEARPSSNFKFPQSSLVDSLMNGTDANGLFPNAPPSPSPQTLQQQQLLQQQISIQLLQQQLQQNVMGGGAQRTFTFHAPTDFSQKPKEDSKKRRVGDEYAIYDIDLNNHF